MLEKLGWNFWVSLLLSQLINSFVQISLRIFNASRDLVARVSDRFRNESTFNYNNLKLLSNDSIKLVEASKFPLVSQNDEDKLFTVDIVTLW